MRKFLHLVGILILIFAVLPVRAETADDFLKAYFLLQDGDAAEKGGENPKAVEKYTAALKILRTIKRKYPDWNPNIIAYRSKYCTEHIVKAGGKIEPEDAAPEPEVAAPATPTTPAPVAEPGKPVNTVPTGVTPAPAPEEEKTAPVSSAPADRITALERDLSQARSDLKKMQTEKAEIESRLRKAEAELRNSNVPTDEKVKTLKDELAKTQAALDAVRKENEELKASNESLKKDLDETRTQLKTATSSAASTIAPEVLQTLQKENALLRSIVDRQFQEDAKRSAARDTLAVELKELGSRTEAIRAQIEILQMPLSPLSDEEKQLLRTPATALRPTDDPSKLSGVVTATKSNATTTGDSAIKLSAENAALAADAKRLFTSGDIDGAAKKYEVILQTEPKNIFALSNLGVIRFRQDKIDEAAKHLSAALAIDRDDAFSLSVLGIVQYRQGKFDDAVGSLTRAIALAPTNYETHNYLGITYSQKGYQEAAEKELLKALELKPDYGDAHFNLAVVYASQNPPSNELARKHYKTALEMGVPKDPELEKLLVK